MIKDPLAWFFIIFGLLAVVGVVYMEYSNTPGWIDSPLHTLAVTLTLGMGIGSLYYAHNRIDNLNNEKLFDEIYEQLDDIHEDVHGLKEEIQKITQNLNDVKQSKQ